MLLANRRRSLRVQFSKRNLAAFLGESVPRLVSELVVTVFVVITTPS